MGIGCTIRKKLFCQWCTHASISSPGVGNTCRLTKKSQEESVVDERCPFRKIAVTDPHCAHQTVFDYNKEIISRDNRKMKEMQERRDIDKMVERLPGTNVFSSRSSARNIGPTRKPPKGNWRA